MNNTDNNINEEKWKRVVDFPSYEISNLGRVRNATGKILKPQKNKTNGYMQIMLHNGINGNKIKAKRGIYQLQNISYIKMHFNKLSTLFI